MTIKTTDQTPELLRHINAISLLAHDALSPQDLLEKSLKMTLGLFKAQRGSIFLLSAEAKELALKAAVGMKDVDKKKMVKKLGQGIVGRVAELKEPLLVGDIASDKRFKNYQARKSYDSASFICSPMMVKDRLIGVINISDKISGLSFNQDELQILDFLSSQIALNYQHFDFLNKPSHVQERLITLGKLAGGIAHEFNNPLDGVMRYTNLCLDHAQDDDVLREYLMEIKQGLKRMANIVKNLLACARNSQGAPHEVDVHQAVDQALKEWYPHLASKNIQLVKKFAQRLPEISDWGLERIVSNLVKNAIDAIEKSGTIEIATSLEKGNVKIEVRDTGKGIPESDLEKIFEPFYTTKEIDQGCGLGLTIVHEIVKYYNGTIEVDSTVGKGTVFTVSLPAPVIK